MPEIQIPESCPKCGVPNPHTFFVHELYWRPLYCHFWHGCSHDQTGEHLYIRCYCGYEFGSQPCADAEKKKVAA